MNLHFSLTDLTFDNIKLGGVDIDVNYTTEEALAILNAYATLVPQIVAALAPTKDEQPITDLYVGERDETVEELIKRVIG